MRIAVISESPWAAAGVAAALAAAAREADEALDIIALAADDTLPADAAWLFLHGHTWPTRSTRPARATASAPHQHPIARLAADAPLPRLKAALAALQQGLSVQEPGLAAIDGEWPARIDEQRPAPADELRDPLTPRELQVFELLAKGLANHEIAAALGISRHTAKFHVAQILDKTGSATRTEAVRQGLRSGLIGL
jgi:DNA-binding CsgD family transcriptional regulator